MPSLSTFKPRLQVAAASLLLACAVQAAPVSFDLPAQPLAQTLKQIAAQDGLTLLVDSQLVAGKSAPAVKGSFEATDALRQVLAGSGLTLRIDGNTVLVEAAPPAANAVMLGAVKVESTSTATTEGSGSYTTRQASTSTRLPLSLRETPQSVSVITRQQIEDRNFVTLDDAMEMATGISPSTANFNRISYTARGFTLTDNMIDGMPAVGNAYAGYVPNLAFYDRVEILRGSAGLVYGAGSAGGAVNLVRKRPTSEPQLSAVMRRSRWNNNYVELDASRPLNGDASVRGRLVVTYEDKETFIDGETSRKPAVYSIIEADIADGTTIFGGGSMERYDGNFSPIGLPRYTDGRDLHLPRSSRGMAPIWNDYYTDVDTFFGGVDHRFNDRWTLRLAGNVQNRVQGGLTINTTGAVDPETLAGPNYSATIGDSYSPGEYQAYDAVLNGDFDLLGRSHDVVIGYTWSEVNSKRSRTAAGARPDISQTNIFDFDPYAIPRPSLGAWTPAATSTKALASGAYTTVRLNVADPLKLIFGGRLSSAENQTHTYATSSTAKTRESDVFTPFGGLIYDFADQWSAYASYSDIFRVQNTSFSVDGSALKPVVGANYEAGVKGEFYDGLLNASFAVFRVEETNRAMVDPEAPFPCPASAGGTGDCFIASGKVRGQGFETEISGQVVAGLELTAGYTYVETEFLRDRTRTGEPSSNEGRAFRTTTPKNLFKLWGTYRLPGDWARWSLGAGALAQSDIYNLADSTRIEHGGYTIYNARVAYELDDHWNLSLNGNNLTDKRYYQRLGLLTGGNRYGEPMSYAVTLRGNF